MRERAVVLAPRLPWPLDDGGRIGLWQITWSAAQAFDTTLLCLVPPGTENAPLPKPFLDLGIEVVRVPHSPPPLPVAAWRGLLGRWPYTLARFRNRQFALAVRDLAERLRPRFFLVNHLHLATYTDDMRGVPMILREHNLEYLWMERFAAELPLGAKRLYASLQSGRLRKAEIDLCRRSTLVLAIQDQERDELRRLVPGVPIETVPIAIDSSQYGPWQPESPPIVLIAGAFDWRPNADGALRFLRESWPLIAKKFPKARLRIAGRRPPTTLLEAGRLLGAEVTEYVEDMRSEFRRAAVLVVPLWVGAGVRVKIVEALASGLPVVSTPLGAEGLGLATGEGCLVSESADGLASSVLSLLEPERALRLSREGPAIVQRQWSLESVARLQNEYCAMQSRRSCA